MRLGPRPALPMSQHHSSPHSPRRRARPSPHIPSPYVSPSFSAAAHALRLIDHVDHQEPPAAATATAAAAAAVTTAAAHPVNADNSHAHIHATLGQLRTLRDQIWTHLHSTCPPWTVLTPAIASLHDALATTQTVSHLKQAIAPNSALNDHTNHVHMAAVVQSAAQLSANVDLAAAVRDFAHLLRAAHIHRDTHGEVDGDGEGANAKGKDQQQQEHRWKHAQTTSMRHAMRVDGNGEFPDNDTDLDDQDDNNNDDTDTDVGAADNYERHVNGGASFGDDDLTGLPRKFLHRAAAIHRACEAASNSPLSKLAVLDDARAKLAREHAELQQRLEDALRNGVFASESHDPLSVDVDHQDINVTPMHTPMTRRRGVMDPEETADDKRVAAKQTEELESFDRIALARSPASKRHLIPSDALPAIVQAVDLLGGPNHAAHVLRHAASSRLSSLVRDAILHSSAIHHRHHHEDETVLDGDNNKDDDAENNENAMRAYIATTWSGAHKVDAGNNNEQPGTSFEFNASRSNRAACAAVFETVRHDMTAVLRRLSGLAEAVDQDGDMVDAVNHIWTCMETTLVSFVYAVLDMSQQSTCSSPTACSSPSSSSPSPRLSHRSPPSSSPSSLSFVTSHMHPSMGARPLAAQPIDASTHGVGPVPSSSSRRRQPPLPLPSTKTTTAPVRISLLPTAASAARLKSIHAMRRDDATHANIEHHHSNNGVRASSPMQSMGATQPAKNTTWELDQAHVSSVDSLASLVHTAADFSPTIYNLEVAYTPLQQFILTSTRLRHAWKEPGTISGPVSMSEPGAHAKRKKKAKKLVSSTGLLSETLARAVDLFIRTLQHDVHTFVRDTVLGKRVGTLLKFQRRRLRPSSTCPSSAAHHHHHHQRPFSSDRLSTGSSDMPNNSTTSTIKSTTAPLIPMPPLRQTRMLIDVVATCLRLSSAIPSIATRVGDIVDRDVLAPYCSRAAQALDLVSGWSDGGVLFDEMNRLVDISDRSDTDDIVDVDIDIDADLTLDATDVDRFDDEHDEGGAATAAVPSADVMTNRYAQAVLLPPYVDDDDYDNIRNDDAPMPLLRSRGVQGLATKCLNAMCERDQRHIRQTRVLLANEWDAVVRLVSNAKLIISELQACVSGRKQQHMRQRCHSATRFGSQHNTSANMNEDSYDDDDDGGDGGDNNNREDDDNRTTCATVRSADGTTKTSPGDNADGIDNRRSSVIGGGHAPTRTRRGGERRAEPRQASSLYDVLRNDGVIVAASGLHAPVLDAIRRMQPGCKRLREDVIDRGLVLLHCEVVLHSFSRAVQALAGDEGDSDLHSQPPRERFKEKEKGKDRSRDGDRWFSRDRTAYPSSSRDILHRSDRSLTSGDREQQSKGLMTTSRGLVRMSSSDHNLKRTDHDHHASDGGANDMNEFDEFGDRITITNDDHDDEGHVNDNALHSSTAVVARSLGPKLTRDNGVAARVREFDTASNTNQTTDASNSRVGTNVSSAVRPFTKPATEGNGSDKETPTPLQPSSSASASVLDAASGTPESVDIKHVTTIDKSTATASGSNNHSTDDSRHVTTMPRQHHQHHHSTHSHTNLSSTASPGSIVMHRHHQRGGGEKHSQTPLASHHHHMPMSMPHIPRWRSATRRTPSWPARDADKRAVRHGRAFGDAVAAMERYARANIGEVDTRFVLAGADHAVGLGIKLSADRERATAAKLFLDAAAAIAADTLGWPGVDNDYSVAEAASQSAAECRALLFAAGLL